MTAEYRNQSRPRSFSAHIPRLCAQAFLRIALAKRLNTEHVPGPGGASWNPSTIHGNPARGTGALNNELYIGRLVWNRLRYVKDPDTGKRVSRPNPQSQWVTTSVPDLRNRG